MIEPVRLALTTSNSPARSAAIEMMSSAALPKVAFMSPPTPAPKREASRSVASPRSPASGTIASPASTNTATGPQWSHSPRAASGTKTSSSRSTLPA